MRKLLFLFVLLTSIGIAHAEIVAGFEMGGKLPNSEKYSEASEKMLPYEYIVNDVKFFDSAQVGTDEQKIIKSLSFVKNCTLTMGNLSVTKRKIKKDFITMMDVLEKKYGEFDKSEASSILSRVGDLNGFYMGAFEQGAKNVDPKSEIIGLIVLLASSPESKNFPYGAEKEARLQLVYMDKTLVDKILENKASELEGF
jgi:predicted type IV restriction endonuclease